MFLKKLEINGFKSFAKKTVLEFNKTMTAIVGPNGSGKSNIADAVRWVLGEQSLKTLRSKNSQDVIFAGSDKKTRLGFAEVSLYLDNSNSSNGTDNIDPQIEYPEVVITRRIYRNGDSEYLLNKSKVRLVDVQLFMAKSNFGQKSYSIVGQGMVDSILFSSPQERKAFFDEATGVRQYQIKREQSIRKLENTNENLGQVEMLLQEIEPQVKYLKRQVKKLEQREELSQKLIVLQKKYYSSVWTDVNEDFINYEKEKKELSKKKKNAETELNSAREQMKSLSLKTANSQESRELQSKYQKLLEQKSALREKEVVLKSQVAFKPADGKKIMPSWLTEDVHREIESLKKQQDDLLDNIAKAKDVKILHFLEEKLTIIIKKTENILEKFEPFIPKKAKPEIKKIIDLSGDIQLIDDQLINVKSKIETLANQEENERKEIWHWQSEFTGKQDQYNKINQTVNDVEIKLARLGTRREDLEMDMRNNLDSSLIKDIKNIANNRDDSHLFSEIHRLKSQLELIGGIDPEIKKECEDSSTRFEFLTDQSDDLRKSIKSLGVVISELDEQIKKQFNSQFEKINQQFNKYFKILFDGGNAKLILESDCVKVSEDKKEPGLIDEIDKKRKNKRPIFCGIEIQATPPGKKLQNINMLSGGEKALTSIALICAIINFNPSPFIVLDEVDAALDEANSERFAKIIGQLVQKTQFIAITHNRATMHQANVLYGVTMGDDGVSKLLSMDLER